MKEELLAAAERLGEERRSPLADAEELVTAEAFVEADLLPTEPVTVIHSERAWVRAAKGHEVAVRSHIVPEGVQVLLPRRIQNVDEDLLEAITTSGYTLVFPVKEFPELAHGKGNKILNVPMKRLRAEAQGDREVVAHLITLPPAQTLRIHAGRQSMNVSPKDLENFRGARNLRGGRLPKGYRSVDRVGAET